MAAKTNSEHDNLEHPADRVPPKDNKKRNGRYDQ
jgi:hypothetical protein